ncbi:MAG TPA: crossover junction endodeoxyribonuclease RuvC [Abditibacteriaceae bacterium]|nr:crossover junction endodeoxyribonuclease RuvC [Abditibacteriaceae bacterium]
MTIKTQPFPTAQHRAVGRADSTSRRIARLNHLPPASRVLGVDPGLHRTGYGVIEIRNAKLETRNPQLIEGGVLKARASDDLAERLQTLYDALCEVLAEHQPDVMVIEELFSTYAHPRSALLMAHARGVMLLAAQQAHVAVHHFLPNEVKQVLTGNGHATKRAMQAAVRTRLSLASAPEPADVADALACALCFAARQSVARRLAR